MAYANKSAFLQAKLAVRAKPNKLQYSIIRFTVNQDQIGPDVTIPIIFPFTG